MRSTFMSNQRTEQPTPDTIRAKSVDAVQVTKSGHCGEPPHPTIPVTRRKRWRFAGLIALILLGVIMVIGYRLQSDSAGWLAGLGVAFCAIACGGLLVRRELRVMAEEDKLQEEQLNANQATVSPPEQIPAGQETNLTTPPPGAGQNENNKTENL